MKLWLFLVVFLAVFGTLCTASGWDDTEEEEEAEDVENAEDPGEDEEEPNNFSFIQLEMKNRTLENPELEEMREKFEHWRDAELDALIYLKEKMEALEEQVELNADSLTSTDVVTRTCGGFVELSEVHNIIYRAPDQAEPGDYVSCLWLVWAVKTGPIGVQVVYNELAQFDPSFKLAVTYDFSVNGSFSQEFDLDEEGTFKGQFIGIFFHASLTSRGQGVHLRLSDAGEDKSEVEPTVLIFPPDDDNEYNNSQDPENDDEKPWTERGLQQFKYPGNGRDYGASEKLFILGNPLLAGAVLNTTISNIDTEDCCDWVTMVYMDPEDPDLILSEIRRGRESGQSVTLTLDDRMPFLIYFSSDEFGHGKGFSLSYQYYEQQEQGSE